MVLLHHICLTYGAHSGWYFYEYIDDPFTNLLMNLYMSVGRTWVLGCFFMISGYVTPGSLDKKGTWGFIKERLIRIGIPLAIFMFLIRPSLFYVMHRAALSSQYTWLENLYLFKNVAPGPAWFLEVLLVFSVFYAFWNLMRKTRHGDENRQQQFPSKRNILLFIIALAFFTFVIRILLPTDKEVFHLRLGNYAEYVAFFAAGIMAYRRGWANKITDAIGWQWTIVTLAASCLYAFFVVSAWSSNMSLSFLRGGLSGKTLIATCVETVIAVGSSISLPYLFSKFFNGRPDLIKKMSQDAYAVFVFHSPIIVAISCFMQGKLLGYPFVKVVFVFVAGIALSFLICHFVIRKLPFAKRIL
jgi:glucans biosynthesis protein C